MDLLIVRHGRAMEQDEFAIENPGQDDSLRPLTEEGIRLMKKGAKALYNVFDPPNAIWTSGYQRARQTAEILSDLWVSAPLLEVKELEADRPLSEILDRLKKNKLESLVLVGHEPNLGLLASALLASDKSLSFVEFKKGAAAYIRFEHAQAREGSGSLKWLLQPSHMRRLAEAER